MSEKPIPTFKLWFETKEGYIFGQGTIELLQSIRKLGTLSAAARATGISYRHAWGMIKKTERRIGKPLIKTVRGGAPKGGAELTETGEKLIREFAKYRNVLSEMCLDELVWEGLFVKISARNHIKGRVLSIEKGDVAATVKIEIETPTVITAFITKEAVNDLNIKEGDQVAAVIKATEVMVSKEID